MDEALAWNEMNFPPILKISLGVFMEILLFQGGLFGFIGRFIHFTFKILNFSNDERTERISL